MKFTKSTPLLEPPVYKTRAALSYRTSCQKLPKINTEPRQERNCLKHVWGWSMELLKGRCLITCFQDETNWRRGGGDLMCLKTIWRAWRTRPMV